VFETDVQIYILAKYLVTLLWLTCLNFKYWLVPVYSSKKATKTV